ncbi:MAG: DUF362 domain-containing protein [Bacillota bacterium]
MPEHINPNAYTDDQGRALVGSLKLEGGTVDRKASIKRTVDLIGGFGRAIKPGQRVLIKPNFNSPDPVPARGDPDFIVAVIDLLREEGVDDITVAESSGGPWLPTRDVLDRTGFAERMRRHGVPLVILEEGEFETIEVPGARHLKKMRIARPIFDYDRLIYLPNLKTHKWARFTMSIKLSMGLTHPADREGMHQEGLEEKVAELGLVVRPDLIILDGRKAFVTQGPSHGELVEPNVIMASGDQVAMDVEAVKVLQSYKAENRIGGDPWELPQIKVAAAAEGRVRGPGDYVVRKT